MKLNLELQCQVCKSLPVEPVTCIPCGHSFCKGCHYGTGSHKQRDSGNPKCKQCSDNSITMYVYRNEYIEELMKMFDLIKNSKEIVMAVLVK